MEEKLGGNFSQICCGELALSEQVSLVCYFCGSTFLLSLPGKYLRTRLHLSPALDHFPHCGSLWGPMHVFSSSWSSL